MLFDLCSYCSCLLRLDQHQSKTDEDKSERTNSSADRGVFTGSGVRPIISAVKIRKIRFQRLMAGMDKAEASSCKSALFVGQREQRTARVCQTFGKGFEMT